MATPRAAGTSSANSIPLKSGHAGEGNPRGIAPTTATPDWSRWNTATIPAASSIAIRGPGSRGNQCWTANRSTSMPTASASVGRWIWSSWVATERSSSKAEPPPSVDPGDLAELADDHQDGDAGQIADQHRAR